MKKEYKTEKEIEKEIEKEEEKEEKNLYSRTNHLKGFLKLFKYEQQLLLSSEANAPSILIEFELYVLRSQLDLVLKWVSEETKRFEKQNPRHKKTAEERLIYSIFGEPSFEDYMKDIEYQKKMIEEVKKDATFLRISKMIQEREKGIKEKLKKEHTEEINNIIDFFKDKQTKGKNKKK